MRRPVDIVRQIRLHGQPESSGTEITEGPIWTMVVVTTHQGSRDDSPEVTRDHVDFVDHEVSRIFTLSEVKERLDFVSEMQEFDISTDKKNDLVIQSFVRHREDMLSVRHLDEVIDVLEANINPHEDLTVRDYRVVSEGLVRQNDPLFD